MRLLIGRSSLSLFRTLYTVEREAKNLPDSWPWTKIWLTGLSQNLSSVAVRTMASRSWARILFHAIRFTSGFGLAHLRSFLGSIPNIRQARFWVNPWETASLMLSTTAVLVSFLKCPLSAPKSPNPFFFLTRTARGPLRQGRLLFLPAVLRLFGTVLRV